MPTINLAQGIAAVLAFDSSQTMEENTAAMTEAAQSAHCAAVSIAVRDSVVGGLPIIKGDYIGLLENKIVCTGSGLNEAAVGAVQKAGTDWELLLWNSIKLRHAGRMPFVLEGTYAGNHAGDCPRHCRGAR